MRHPTGPVTRRLRSPQINHGRGGQFLDGISARFLKEEGLLVERFEELHQGLFDVTIIYFAVCTFLILRITRQYAEWDLERRRHFGRPLVMPKVP